MRRPWQALVLSAIFFLAQSAIADVVKQSTSGICHSSDSPYYERTTNFVSYQTLEACLTDGGRLPKGSKERASREAPGDGANYKREYFGWGWADNNGDCRNARNEALESQSTAPVRFKTEHGCQVIAGRWISPFTNTVIHDPSRMDIDHVVPLKWAWDHGASKWDQDKRERFANDPANLLSVEAALNRSKGSRGLAEWLPPANQCQYILRFIRVMKRYKLSLSEPDVGRYEVIRKENCDR